MQVKRITPADIFNVPSQGKLVPVTRSKRVAGFQLLAGPDQETRLLVLIGSGKPQSQHPEPKVLPGATGTAGHLD